MKSALHGDGAQLEGYYSSRIETVGASGDFSTAATLHPAFGTAVGRWARTELRSQGLRHLIECGPGDGSLLLHVSREIGRWGRLSRRIQFHLVESSSKLRQCQRKRLRGLPVKWHPSIEAALDACQGEAVIYSNEFADAFPVTLLQWSEPENNWQEVYVEHDQAWNVSAEYCVPFEVAPKPTCSALEFPKVREGQRVELGLDYAQWLESMASHFHRGSLLTIDYGDSFPQLYHRRPNGTLRAYRGHQRMEGAAVYEEPGHRDLTADVNFTDLTQWGRALNWDTQSLESQTDFLLRQSPELAERSTQDPKLGFLLDPMGAGTAFQVLHQRKGSKKM